MRHIRALLPLSLVSLGAAEIVGQWTAWTLTRTCFDNGTSCTYHLALDQNPYAKSDLSTCIWTVNSLIPSKPANQTDFANVQCGAKLSLNGGWSNKGFFTIVPTDKVANAYAFFGFTDEEIKNGKTATPRQRPAYRVGTFSEDEHPDLGLGMLKKMKTEKRDHRGRYDCIWQPDGEMEKRSPTIALESNQQQSDSSSHKMDGLMKVEKKSSPVLNTKPLEKKQVHLRPEDCPTYPFRTQGCYGPLKKRLSIPSQQEIPLPNSNKQQQSSTIDSCTKNCTTDDDRYDTLSCLSMCREQIHGAKISADALLHPRNHNELPAVANLESQNSNTEQPTAQDTWQIHALTRLTNPPLNLTIFTFSIVSIPPTTTTAATNNPVSLLANCSITITSASPTHSWYGQRCNPLDNKYTVGWGYNSHTDSAVMTICRPGTGMAWFGWDGVAGTGNKADQQNKEVEVRFGDSRREGVHRGVCT